MTHNGPNGALKRGLEALDVHCDEIPRNCNDAVCSGFCAFGCASGDKQVSSAAPRDWHQQQILHIIQAPRISIPKIHL